MPGRASLMPCQRPEWAWQMEEPPLFLQLLRERVMASIVLQRRFPVRGGSGVTVIARRSPVGGAVTWMHSYDAGLDPDDPDVREVAELGLEFMQANLAPEMRKGAFGPEQPAPPGAGAYDRIAAFAGRHVTR